MNDEKLTSVVKHMWTRFRPLTLLSFVLSSLGVASALLSVLSIKGLSEIRPLLNAGVAALAGAAFTQMAATFAVRRLAGDSSDAARLKKQIASAYRAALQSSPMNPSPAQGKSHG
jgi:hypothetical protein